MKKISASVVILLLLSIVLLVACNTTEQYFVYGTFLEVSVKGAGGSKICQNIYDTMASYETVLSPTVEGSDVNRVNSAEVGVPVLCNALTIDIARIAYDVYIASEGAYDPSIYPLVRLWRFSGDLFTLSGQTKQPPSDADIQATLSLVGFSRAFTIDYENLTITKNIEGAMLDFGGIAKGYSVEYVSSSYVGDKKALVNLGGNIACFNGDFTIGITSPRDSDSSIFGKVKLSGGDTISTSGDYERYYWYEGARYHHIINPSTGYPSASGLISVTVIANSASDNYDKTAGGLGDAVSTAVMVLGEEKGETLINSLGLKAVFIYSDLSYKIVGDFDFSKS